MSIKPLHDVLKCISFKPQALVRLSEEGLRFSVEDSRSLQAHAFLDNTLFSSFSFAGGSDEVVSFSITLSALMEVLGIYNPAYGQAFTSNSNNVLRLGGTLRITYKELGSSLDLILEENNVLTKCSLTTYEPDELVDIDILTDPAPDKIIMRSEWLHDAMIEMDAGQTDALTLRQSPRRPFLRLSSKGLLGSVQMDYPNDRSVLETFSCSEDVKNTYKFSMLKTSLRAMKESSRISLRTDEHGTLSMQFMIAVGEGRNSFVEFRMLALDQDEAHAEVEEANHANETLDF